MELMAAAQLVDTLMAVGVVLIFLLLLFKIFNMGRRRFQFGIRQLIAATLVVAFALSCIRLTADARRVSFQQLTGGPSQTSQEKRRAFRVAHPDANALPR